MTLAETQEKVADHLDEIKRYFKAGAKVTIFVRFPDDPEGRKDFVMGDDDLLEVMNMAARRRAAGQQAEASSR
jgi:hypothetical protein